MKSNILLLNNLKLIKNILPVKKIQTYKNEVVLFVAPDFLFQTLFLLKNHSLFQYNLLVHITAVDFPKKKHRFEVVYELLSIRYNNRIKVKVCLNELTNLKSCEKLFSAANWFECEVFDMYGIFFSEHSNLKRILTDYGFEGYPLRKDFPLSGYIEVKYDEKTKRVVNEYLELAQEYRTFDFQSPWNSLKV
jgi:NADH dehydrogenase (ubiquinone) Fe-S protein 3